MIGVICEMAGTDRTPLPVPTGHHCISPLQETLRKWFPIRHETMVYHSNRKPFANSFLSCMILWYISSMGNPSQTAAHPAWLHGVSSPQEKAPAFAGAFSCEIVYTKRRALWLTVIPGRPWILSTGRPFLSWLPQLLFRGLSGVLRISDRCRRSFRGFSRSFLFSVLPGYLLQRGDSWI